MQLITFPKRYHSSKSIHGDRRYLPFCAKKQAKSNKINNFFFSGWIFINFTRLAALNQRYLWSPWIDFDEKYLFGNVNSCTFYDKNFATKFDEFRCQIWLQSWNLLEIGRAYRELESFKLFVGTYITFLKGYDEGFTINLKNLKS